jgi:hypothetical protein
MTSTGQDGLVSADALLMAGLREMTRSVTVAAWRFPVGKKSEHHRLHGARQSCG